MSASESIDVRSTSQTVNRNMIAILTDHGTGGTFLNWTIHYLRGDNTYYNAWTDKNIEVISNPIKSSNAHGFWPNQPDTLVDFEKIFVRLQRNPQNSSVYFHNFFNLDESETRQAIDLLNPVATHKIVVTNDIRLYYCTYKNRAGVSRSKVDNQLITDPDKIHNEYIRYYFPESIQFWEQLTDIWDKREFIALTYDPFACQRTIADCFDSTMPRYDITAIDLWTTFDQSVFDLFAYLNTEIDQTRYQAWLLVYTEWKKLHRQRLMFAWYYKTIVHNIVHGIDYDLIKFDLDLRQEAAIQHALIYQHNLNLKTWQLEKFTNTRQLHQLLEPNTHDLSRSQIKDFGQANL